MEKNKSFIRKYGDTEQCTAWLEDTLLSSDMPPVFFTADGVLSKSIRWKKKKGKTETYTDYPKTDWPVQRIAENFVYTAEQIGLEIRTEFTYYPDYPIAEYCSVITNISDKNSPRLQNLLNIDCPVIKTDCGGILHSFRGDTDVPDSYRPLTEKMTAGSEQHFEVTCGRPTTTFLPNFNFEIPEQNCGVIAVLGWAGNWKADFRVTETDVTVSGGPHTTDFVLQPGESYRLPITVLLFYKGSHIDGQNLWRRWMYEHNIMRAQGVRYGVRVLSGVSQGWQMRAVAADSINEMRWAHEHGFTKLIDEFNQDAGWYPDKEAWHQLGEWRPDPIRFPNGLAELADAVHALGLQFRLWFEPERVEKETLITKTHTIPGEFLIGITKDAEGNTVFNPTENYPEDISNDRLVNYAIPEAVDRTIEYVNAILDVGKVDVYRQDFNMDPGPYWKAYDEYISGEMGIPRYGLTEEKHIAGYRRLWSSILERHPGMVIDGCASGGRRNDLETLRYSYPHTRTDYWKANESTQNHTYGAAQWLVVMGGSCVRKKLPEDSKDFITYPDYNWRSATVTYRGFGFIAKGSQKEYTPESIERTRVSLQNWRKFAEYMFYDFYPLTDYSTENDAVISYQYDSPEKGIGMAVIYLRPEVTGDHTVYLTHLDEEAMYILHDEDGVQPDRTVNGAELMQEGITVTARDVPAAPFFTYRRV